MTQPRDQKILVSAAPISGPDKEPSYRACC